MACLRPTPPDDIPIIGSLRFYPNVYLNAGHSARGTTLGLATSKLTSELIMKGEDQNEVLGVDMKKYSPRRF